MICPFRVGIKFEYEYIGENADDSNKREMYLESSQHAYYEECEKEECPYYEEDYISSSGGKCNRIGEGEYND